MDETGRDQPGQLATGSARARVRAALNLAEVESTARIVHQQREDALPHTGSPDRQVESRAVLNH